MQLKEVEGRGDEVYTQTADLGKQGDTFVIGRQNGLILQQQTVLDSEQRTQIT